MFLQEGSLSWGLLLLAFVLWVAYSIQQVIYNVWFHPLAKFPGPTLRAAFHFPYLWSLYKGVSVQQTKRFHDRYGEVVRINPQALSFSSGAAWKDIYGAKPGKVQLPRDEEFFVDEPDRVNIIKSNDVHHARMRRHIISAFSDVALREQEPLLKAHTDLFISQMKKFAQSVDKKSVDLRNWYNFLTFDVIGDMVLGESFHALTTGEFHHWVAGMFVGFKFWPMLRFGNSYPLIGLILRLMVEYIPALAKKKDAFFKLPSVRIEARMKEQNDRKDIMTYILRDTQDKSSMSKAEIVDTACIFIVGGSETTAALLCGATSFLLENPIAGDKARAEVRAAFKEETDINLLNLTRLPYLQALIDESLRLYPPAPSIFPRRTANWETIAGHAVPPNTSVGVHQFATYRSATNFANPEEFRPERWLSDGPTEFTGDKQAACQPFHVGPRSCIGRTLALFEACSTLARMLWNFDMELCDDSSEWTEHQKHFVVWDKPPLNVRLSFRSGLDVE